MTLAAIEMHMWGVDRETISSDLEEYAPAFNDGSKGWQQYFTEIKEEILNTVFNQLPKSESERGLLTERFTGDGNCEFKVDVIDNDSMVLYYE
ncbi:hypothetical protein [Vibrio phage vB_VmeM-Yong XC32]|nr:hypothetical protein [Vibrio phage vB_VmeM-Yong XC31]QAX96387.1 hypothetical protein [Vibrio phage vB_VmeM-Yong XC32]QAX96705.1 hypothetical protein [Vibrio phage vB_VmeM-Yong MS31]QAX97023.1 hypothetical protein [Vibrio phage vB_VmeM-Yong MS32]